MKPVEQFEMDRLLGYLDNYELKQLPLNFPKKKTSYQKSFALRAAIKVVQDNFINTVTEEKGDRK